MRQILVATRSEDKLREISQILARPQLQLLSLRDAGIAPEPAEDDVEAYGTFRENASAKAAYFAARSDLPVLADDSGIEVDALDGAPGVLSRRFSGRTDLDGNRLDQANNQFLLQRLAGLPPARRGAGYFCAAVLRSPNGHVITALGTVRGEILGEARGQGGFGYDPLFLLPQAGRTFGELDPVEKHRYSHRARAFRALAGCL